MTLPTTSNVSNPQAWGYDVRLGTLYLRSAQSNGRQLIEESAPLQTPRIDTTANAEEVTSEFGLKFSRNDFSGGEGLEYAHRVRGTDRDNRRYYDSRNIEVDDSGNLTLLETSEELESNAAAIQYATHADGAVWYTAGTTLRKTSNPTAASPTWADDDPHAGEGATTVTGVTALGTTVYAALGANGIHRLTSGGAWAHWSDLTARRIWAVKGRILADDGNGDLYEADAAAASVALATGVDDMVWNDVADGQSHVLAAASDGNIYSFSFDGTDLALVSQSDLLSGEEPTAIARVLNLIVIATREEVGTDTYVSRLYTCQLATDGTLAELTLVKEFDEGEDRWICGMEGVRGTSVYFGLPESGDLETHLWRYDVAEGGLHRHYISEEGEGCVYSLFSVQEKLWWTIGGQGPQRTTEDYATSGYLISALADFSTGDEKSWAGVLLNPDSLPANTNVSLQYTSDRAALEDADHPSWEDGALVQTLDAAREVTIEEVQSRYLAVKLKLTGDSVTPDPSVTPVLSSFSVRAYPTGDDFRISVPVNVSDQVERFGRKRTRAKGRGDELFEELIGLEGTTRELELIKKGITFSGTVERVTQPSPMRVRRGSDTLVSTIVFRGRKVQFILEEIDIAEDWDWTEDVAIDFGLVHEETWEWTEEVSVATYACAFPSSTTFPDGGLLPC